MKTLIFLVLGFSYAFSCLNGDENIKRMDLSVLDWIDNPEKQNIKNGYKSFPGISLLKKQHKKSSKRIGYKIIAKDDDLAKLGLKNIYLQNFETALDNLEKAYALDSMNYVVASNLAAAYEFNGKPKLATKFIRKAMELDSTSHFGTEWLHLYIIENKMGLKDKLFSDMIKYNGLKTTVGIDGKYYNVKQIIKAINYQLKERLLFVKDKSNQIADLLYVYGRICEMKNQTYKCKEVFDFAKKFEIEAHSKLNERLKSYENDKKK